MAPHIVLSMHLFDPLEVLRAKYDVVERLIQSSHTDKVR
jgi:hypothetical protein